MNLEIFIKIIVWILAVLSVASVLMLFIRMHMEKTAKEANQSSEVDKAIMNTNRILMKSYAKKKEAIKKSDQYFTDPYLNTKTCVERLVHEWETYGMLIIAYDFDFTVSDYNNKGFVFKRVPALLRELKQLGCHLIVFTSCDESRFPEIKKYLKENNIPYDSINEGPDFIPFKGRKVYYNALLDDRAGLGDVYMQLSEVLLQIRILKHNKGQQRSQDVCF